MTAPDLSYDVRIWDVEVRAGARRTTYRVRWFVGSARFAEQFHDAQARGLLPRGPPPVGQPGRIVRSPVGR